MEEFFGIDGVHNEVCSFAAHDTKAVQLYGSMYSGRSTHPEPYEELHQTDVLSERIPRPVRAFYTF